MIVFILTADGRVLVLVIVIKVLPPKSKDLEEFSGDEETDLANSKDVSLEVKANLFQESRVQSNLLDFGEFDNSGTFIAMGGREFNKVFLCEVQKGLEKSGPLGQVSR